MLEAPARADVRLGLGGGERVALLVLDDERRCLEASLAACRLLGVSRSALLGRPLDELLGDPARGRLEHLWLAFRDRGGHAGPVELAAPGRASIEVELTFTANVVPGRHLLVLSPAEPEASPAEAVAEQSAAPRRVPLAKPRVAGAEGQRQPTSREREILGLLAAGATDVQIATRLSLSPATVQTHVRNAKAKLGARTRAQAVALALRRGLIPAR